MRERNLETKEKGITLIALIVTIIILLILAGVTLSLILGGEGILGKATNAVDISNKTQIKEDVELLLTDIKAEHYLSEERATTNFRDYVEKQVKASSGGLKTPNEGYLKWDEEGPFYEDKNGNQYEIEISEEGKVTVGGPISSNPSTDTNPPTVKIDATTSNSITFTMSDGRGSGVKAYAVIEGTNAPSESDWIEVTGAPKTVTQTVTGKQNEKTYYVWAKDVAGNVTNTGTQAITKPIDAASSSNTDYTITWSGTNATVSFTTKTEYEIELSTNNSNWQKTNAITVASGATIYVRLSDGTNGGASYQAVTVKWQGTVTYNANGGTGNVPAQQKASHGDSVQVSFSPVPTRAGYKFLGWAKDNAGATTANFTSSGTKTFTMGTANVTLYAVWEQLITASNISKSPATYLGKTVNYTPPNRATSSWKIFYADSSNIYLIATNYIHKNYMPAGKNGTAIMTGISDYAFNPYWSIQSDYTGASDILASNPARKWFHLVDTYPNSTYPSYKVTAYLLDTDRWNGFVGTKASYAIGGPTLELYCAAYNSVNSSKISYQIYDERGYHLKWSSSTEAYNSILDNLNSYDGLFGIEDTSLARQWGLAEPNAGANNKISVVQYNGNYSKYQYIKDPFDGNTNGVGLRPIVCLKTGVTLEKQANGTYNIK